MANQTLVTLIDDLDGKKADETVVFSLDGAAYEIDLSKKNATTMRKAIAEFIAAGRQNKPATARRGSVTQSAVKRSAAKSAPAGEGDRRRQETKAIREWAEQAGLTTAKRGRLSITLVEQYRAAQAG